MFEDQQRIHRVILPIAFFGVLVSALVFGESLNGTQATTIVTGTPVEHVMQDPKPVQTYPRCEENADCPLPTSYCNDKGKCTELENPMCNCSQTNVLRCYDATGRARFLYCENGCEETSEGLICQ